MAENLTCFAKRKQSKSCLKYSKNTQQQIILLPLMTTAICSTSARLNILLNVYTEFTELWRQEPYTSIELSSFEVQNKLFAMNNKTNVEFGFPIVWRISCRSRRVHCTCRCRPLRLHAEIDNTLQEMMVPQTLSSLIKK